MTTEKPQPSAEDHELEIELARRQPIADAIELAGRAQDFQRERIMHDAAPFIRAAQAELGAGRYENAARQYEAVSNLFRVESWPGEANAWDQRAADCRSAGRHAKRAKKGKGR